MKLTPVDNGIKLEPVKKKVKTVKKPTPKPKPKKVELTPTEKALIQLKEIFTIQSAKVADIVETNASVLRKALDTLNKRQKIEVTPEIVIKEEKKTRKYKVTSRDRQGRIEEVTATEL